MRTRAKKSVSESHPGLLSPPKVTFPNSFYEHLHVKMNWARYLSQTTCGDRSIQLHAPSPPFADPSCSAREFVLFFWHWKPRRGAGRVLPAARGMPLHSTVGGAGRLVRHNLNADLVSATTFNAARSLRCTAPVWSLVRTFVLKFEVWETVHAAQRSASCRRNGMSMWPFIRQSHARRIYILVACGTVAPEIH
jgi:hypothetical protein